MTPFFLIRNLNKCIPYSFANITTITLSVHQREEYDNVVFIYASDDMEWGYKNLNGINDLYLLGAGQNLDEKNQKEVVDPDAAAYDFALLVSCNHTIVTRGTYTMWIAMLAGGEYYTEYGPILGPDAILDGKSK